MHDIRLIRDDPAAFDAALARRGVERPSPALLALDERRRATVAEAQASQTERNALSKAVGQAKAARDEPRAQELMAQVAALKEALPRLEAEETRIGEELTAALAALPNLPAVDVPDGGAPGATSPSRPPSTTRSALRSGSISRRGWRSPARASPCCGAPPPGWRARWGSSCSTG
jgi:seryl-tRNA synthetase